MATTKPKEVAAKEKKRGISPSNPVIRSSSSPRKSLSPLSSENKSTGSSSSETRVPNYLKSTFASRFDSPKDSVKKTETPHMRRRSFDKPPSPHSLNPLSHGPPRDRSTSRSSSFSGKSILPKPKLEKTFVRARSSASSVTTTPVKNVKKSTLSSSSATKKERSKSAEMAVTMNVEIKQENEKAIDEVIEEVQQVHVENLKSEIKDDDMLEIDNMEEGDFDLCDISTVSDDLNATQAALDEEFEKILHVERTDDNYIEYKQSAEESFDQAQPEVEHDETIHLNEESAEDTKLEKDPVEEKEIDDEKRVDADNDVDEVIPAPVNATAKRQIGGHGNKKESPVYNDVIEETAGKLLEKRKNKVKALVGAFETVISLQEPDQI